MDPSLAAYVTLTALLVFTPGASTATVVRHVLRGGRAAGLAAASGIALANTSWAVAAGLGVTTLLFEAPPVQSAIRLGGAAYLAFMGGRALWQAWTPAGAAAPWPPAAAGSAARSRSAFRDGLMVNLLSPPVATFYIAIVPSFLPAPPPPGRFALLGAIHVGMALACHAAWATGFDALRTFWSRPAARRTLDTAIGLALLALAIRMLR